MVDGARKRVRVNKCFSSPAPNWIVNGALADGLFVQVVSLGERGIIGYGVEPQCIVVAVEERVSVLGA